MKQLLALWLLCKCSRWDWLFCTALGTPEILHHPLKQYRTFGWTLLAALSGIETGWTDPDTSSKDDPAQQKPASVPCITQTRGEERSFISKAEGEGLWCAGYLH